MKCSLSDIEGLSAQIENLRSRGPEQLNQAWRDLFESESFLRSLLVAWSVFASVPMVLVSGIDPQWSEWS
jgi:hypothetical protein